MFCNGKGNKKSGIVNAAQQQQAQPKVNDEILVGSFFHFFCGIKKSSIFASLNANK